MTSRKPVDDQLLAGLSAFFQEPDAAKLHGLLQSCLGEFNHLDFKESFPEDAPKLAKHMLGMANTRGGCIVVGVADAKANEGMHIPVGIASPVDPTVLGQKLRDFLPETLDGVYKILTFKGEDVVGASCTGRFFQVIVVQPDERHLPFFPRKQTTGLDPDIIYVRRNAETVKAKKQEIHQIMQRLQAASSTGGRKSEKSLEEHLTQLSQLFTAIPPTVMRKKQGVPNVTVEGFGTTLLNLGLSKVVLDEKVKKSFFKMTDALANPFEAIPNPNLPAESADAFIARMIEAKKRRIEQLLDL